MVNAAVTPGQMRRAARAGDDDFQSARDGAGDIFLQPVRVTVRGDDFGFAGDAEFRQRIGGGLHHRPVRIAAHQNADEG